MAERFDIVVPRKGKDEKTYYTKIGVAFPMEKGGYSIQFEALPIPQPDGRVVALMFPPREDAARSAPALRAPARAETSAFRPAVRPAPAEVDDSDAIPF